MPEYKNQHYVPKHLLRGWTDNERIPVYNIENQQEYPPTSISNLCSEDYFYGGPDAEESMDGLESIHAGIINDLRSTMSFNVLKDIEILHFCIFVLLQRNRTKQTKQETEELIDNLGKEYVELLVETGEVDAELPDGRDVIEMLDDYRISHKRPLALPMFHALTGVDLIIDLEVAIIVDDTDVGFVVSDHPVVHDNRRFKNKIDRFLVGLQSRGLQIFVPISDRIHIMLYDPASYFVEYSDKEKRRVITSSEKVVNGLNDLQIINALENIFYCESGQEERFNNAQERLSEYIEEKKTIFQRLPPEEHDFDTKNEIIESGRRLTKYSPFLPFVKQRVETEFATERRRNVSQQHKDYMNEILEDARQRTESN